MKSIDAYGILTAAEHLDPVAIDVVARELGVGKAEASDTIAGMVAIGMATRIRRGLVLLKPPGELGTPTLGDDIYRAAIALTHPDKAYIGFYTALHHHRLVVRPATTVFVASVPRRRARNVGGTPIRFVAVAPTRLFGIEQIGSVPWSDPERTRLNIADGESAALATTRHRHYTLPDPHGPEAGTPVPQFEIIDNVPLEAWHGS